MGEETGPSTTQIAIVLIAAPIVAFAVVMAIIQTIDPRTIGRITMLPKKTILAIFNLGQKIRELTLDIWRDEKDPLDEIVAVVALAISTIFAMVNSGFLLYGWLSGDYDYSVYEPIVLMALGGFIGLVFTGTWLLTPKESRKLPTNYPPP
jgi:hypothetical protein